jgi:hypothetical protein
VLTARPPIHQSITDCLVLLNNRPNAESQGWNRCISSCSCVCFECGCTQSQGSKKNKCHPAIFKSSLLQWWHFMLISPHADFIHPSHIVCASTFHPRAAFSALQPRTPLAAFLSQTQVYYTFTVLFVTQSSYIRKRITVIRSIMIKPTYCRQCTSLRRVTRCSFLESPVLYTQQYLHLASRSPDPDSCRFSWTKSAIRGRGCR